MSKRNKLTDKQKLFCKEYIIDFNATRAAKAAGYSKKTARFIATENLSKPNIQEQLSKLTEKRNKRLDIKADNVVEELKKLSFSDFTNYAEVKSGYIKVGEKKIKGKLEPIYELRQFIRLKDTDDWTNQAAIKGLSQNKDGTIRLILHDKVRAISELVKHIEIEKPKKPPKQHQMVDKDGNPVDPTSIVNIYLPEQKENDPMPIQSKTKKGVTNESN